jgi:hypothetical protein
MPNRNTFPLYDLIAYRVARELLVAVEAARISNAGLRDQAVRAATAVGLNIAEAVGSRAGLINGVSTESLAERRRRRSQRSTWPKPRDSALRRTHAAASTSPSVRTRY